MYHMVVPHGTAGWRVAALCLRSAACRMQCVACWQARQVCWVAARRQLALGARLCSPQGIGPQCKRCKETLVCAQHGMLPWTWLADAVHHHAAHHGAGHPHVCQQAPLPLGARQRVQRTEQMLSLSRRVRCSAMARSKACSSALLPPISWRGIDPCCAQWPDGQYQRVHGLGCLLRST